MKYLLFLLAIFPVILTGDVPRGDLKAYDGDDIAENVITIQDLQRAAEGGREHVEALIRLEEQLVADGLTAPKKRHGRKIKRTANKQRISNQSRKKSLEALQVIEASKKLKEKFNLSSSQVKDVLAKLSLRGTALEDACSLPISCTESKYRSIDGSCNNLANPDWGMQGTTFSRVLPPSYGDGINALRVASDGSSLTEPMEIRGNVITIYPVDDPTNATLAQMTFGQFITHDMTHSEDFTFENGTSPNCCNAAGQYPTPDQVHPMCASIWYQYSDISHSNCMPLVRSKVGLDYSCTFGHAEQLNSNTHFLDGSQVYGSDLVTANELRLGTGGLLKSMNVNGRLLFPIAPGCTDEANKELAVCFHAGDGRVEENPHLTAMHLLMLREHNRIARQLKEINPQWNDEILYQETRRIVIAQLQHITYNEYLPVLLGVDTMEQYGISTPASGYGTGYDSNVNPTISNDFAAAAFRIPHSSIQGFHHLYDKNDKEEEDKGYTLSDYSFKGSRYLEDAGFFDSSLRGMTKQVPQLIDTFYSTDILNLLYKGNKTYGGDLVAITIQRGREHGIPGYNHFREVCGRPKAKTFDDFYDDMHFQNKMSQLSESYKSVDDVDLYVGCIAENIVQGTKMGPTCLCLIAQQFANTKHGDRFFYDIGGQPHSFTPGQLDQIRKISLARLMCDNNDGSVTYMQPEALKSPIGDNVRIPCSSIPSIDLSLWKE